MEIADELGHKTDERLVSIDEWREGVSNGSITEVFACGTAAVITPVGTLKWRGGEVSSSSQPQVALEIRERLLDVQYGRAEDKHGWMHRLA